jgi:hypothetical protein
MYGNCKRDKSVRISGCLPDDEHACYSIYPVNFKRWRAYGMREGIPMNFLRQLVAGRII